MGGPKFTSAEPTQRPDGLSRPSAISVFRRLRKVLRGSWPARLACAESFGYSVSVSKAKSSIGFGLPQPMCAHTCKQKSKHTEQNKRNTGRAFSPYLTWSPHDRENGFVPRPPPPC